MQKNKIVLVLALGMMLSPLFVVNGEVTTNTTANTNVNTQNQNIKRVPIQEKAKLEEMKAKLMKETEALRKNLETRKAEIEKKINDNRVEKKIRLESKAQERVQVILNKIYNKLNDQLGKLSQVDAKILLKITTFEKEGRNVSLVKAQYTIAKTALDKAKSEILTATMISADQITKETSKGTIRELVKTTEESIRTAGAEYRKILPLLAKIEGDNSVEKEVKTTNTD